MHTIVLGVKEVSLMDGNSINQSTNTNTSVQGIVTTYPTAVVL